MCWFISWIIGWTKGFLIEEYSCSCYPPGLCQLADYCRFPPVVDEAHGGVTWKCIYSTMNIEQFAHWCKLSEFCLSNHIVVIIFLPALGGISPYMSIMWQQPVGIGLTLFLTDLVTWYTMRGLIPPSPGRNRVKRQQQKNVMSLVEISEKVKVSIALA